MLKCGLCKTSQINNGSVLSEAAIVIVEAAIVCFITCFITLLLYKKADHYFPSCDSVALVFLVPFYSLVCS